MVAPATLPGTCTRGKCAPGAHRPGGSVLGSAGEAAGFAALGQARLTKIKCFDALEGGR